MNVELDRQQIYEGESVLYQVTLNHVENPSRPELKGFDDFDVQSAGEQSISSISIFNGRRTELRGVVYRFFLTPKRAGRLEIPGPTVTIDGVTVRGRPVALEVTAPEEQDVAILELSATPSEVYPMQPFTVRLNIAVKALPAPNSDLDPMTLPNQSAALSIPWTDDKELPDGVEAKVAWNRWLRPLMKSGGFSINNIRDPSRGVFGTLFEEVRAATFRPLPRQTQREDLGGRKVEYWEYAFERTFVSANVGQMQFGPATMKGMFVVDVLSSGRRVRRQRVYAVAGPIEVTLRAPPTAGRPDSYLGAIGSFTAGANLSPTRGKVGDPMTLTLWLRGEGTLDRTTAPKLELQEGVSDSFKIYEATEETRGDQRRFVYSLRPKRAEIKEFPTIAMSYFDVQREKYVTLNTDPIELDILPAEQLSGREIAMAAQPKGADPEIEVSAEGIFANVTDLQQLRDETVRPEQWFLGLGGMAAVFLVLSLTVQTLQRRGADPAAARRRSAASRSRARMQKAVREFEAGERRTAADSMGATLIGLVADAFDVPESGLTSSDAVRLLTDASLEPELIARFSARLEACDHIRYGASSRAIDEIAEQTRGLLQELTTALKRKKLLC